MSHTVLYTRFTRYLLNAPYVAYPMLYMYLSIFSAPYVVYPVLHM